VLADSGYVSEDNFARAGAGGLRLLAPLAKDPGRHRALTPKKTPHLDQLPATARGRGRLLHPRGRDDDKMRARTVEPAFGQLKTCQKLTMMSGAAWLRAKANGYSPAPRTTCASCTGTARQANGQRPVAQQPRLEIAQARAPHPEPAFQDPPTCGPTRGFARQAESCMAARRLQRAVMPRTVRAESGEDGPMKPLPTSHLRITRPSYNLGVSERFWVDGLGLDVLFRADGSAEGGHALLMVGWPSAAWHLELVGDPGTAASAAPTEEGLLVLYVGGAADDGIIGRLIDAGGTRVTARNPYWDRWGVTIADPDGYRLVLSTRSWP